MCPSDNLVTAVGDHGLFLPRRMSSDTALGTASIVMCES